MVMQPSMAMELPSLPVLLLMTTSSATGSLGADILPFLLLAVDGPLAREGGTYRAERALRKRRQQRQATAAALLQCFLGGETGGAVASVVLCAKKL